MTVLDVPLHDSLRALKLSGMLETLDARLTQAAAGELGHLDFLQILCQDEITRRDAMSMTRRLRRARFDEATTLEGFDFHASPKLPAAQIRDLAALRWLHAGESVILHGPVGVGKTFAASALGHVACRHGYHVRLIRAGAMLQLLRKSRFDNSRDAEMAALTSVDLLILDDFALEPMSKEESRDVYQLFLERTGRASMIVTSNRDTGEWIAMFDDVLLAQSAVDRFKNSAFDFVIQGESYRPRLKPKLDPDAAPPPAPALKQKVHPRSRRPLTAT